MTNTSFSLEQRLSRILEGVEIISERVGAIADRLDAADRRLELLSIRAGQMDSRVHTSAVLQQSPCVQLAQRIVVCEAYTTPWFNP
ncbi:MAG: hypothetical protein RIQ41_366 [Candidatus Parcubacteria bacterium]|jgi:hypothetical protein